MQVKRILCLRLSAIVERLAQWCITNGQRMQGNERSYWILGIQNLDKSKSKCLESALNLRVLGVVDFFIFLTFIFSPCQAVLKYQVQNFDHEHLN